MLLQKARWLVAAFLSLALWPGLVQSQSAALVDAYQQSSELYAQGRYQEALPFAKEALRLGTEEFGPNDPTTATLLNNLASLYHHQGKYSEAEPLYERTLAIREKALGPEHPDVAQSLNNLGQVYRLQGR